MFIIIMILVGLLSLFVAYAIGNNIGYTDGWDTYRELFGKPIKPKEVVSLKKEIPKPPVPKAPTTKKEKVLVVKKPIKKTTKKTTKKTK